MHNANAFCLLFGTVSVFIKQVGFAILQVGSLQIKDTKSIFTKNVLDAPPSLRSFGGGQATLWILVIMPLCREIGARTPFAVTRALSTKALAVTRHQTLSAKLYSKAD